MRKGVSLAAGLVLMGMVCAPSMPSEAAVLTGVGGTGVRYADQGTMVNKWVKSGADWTYYNAGGVKQTGWAEINGKWYYFGSDGIMKTGWKYIGKKYYFFTKDGAMSTGWKNIGKKTYYFDENGVKQTGWKKIDDKWYFFRESGVMKTGWMKQGEKWYYLDSSGEMVTGQKIIGNKFHDFDRNGVWRGEVKTSGSSSGSSTGGFKYKADAAVEFAITHTAVDVNKGLPRSQCVNGWLCAEFLSNCIGKGGMNEYDQHATFLHDKLAKDPRVTEIVIPMDSKGYIRLENVPKGEITTGDPILLYCPKCTDGHPFVHSLLFVGWSEDGLAKIYCHNNRNVGVVNRWPACYACGAHLTEAHCMHINANVPSADKKYPTYTPNCWMKVKGKTWHINSKGMKEIGWSEIGRKWYYFNEYGEMQTGWQKIDGKWYYMDESGAMANGWQKIGSNWYYFSHGAMWTGWIRLDGKWYYMNQKGIMVTGTARVDGKNYTFRKNGTCVNP